MGDERGAPVGRRVFLGLVGLGALGVAVGAPVQRGLSEALAPVQLRDPTGLTALLPLGNEFRFYSVTGAVTPADPATYRLTVDGLVQRPGSYSLDDLATLPQTGYTRDFQCVTGWRVLDVAFSGVAVATLLDAAGAQDGADGVTFTSFDGTYTESLTMAQARASDAIVATSMLGAPVTHDHGGPVRTHVGSMYGYKGTKWLSGITVTRGQVDGYWKRRGYDVDGTVGASNGRQDSPT
ncbi:molybdopterin-dependent oxidoreductase [Rhodococcus aerolatus]